MGTAITLDVEGLSLDYAKNHMGADHGALFQERDRTDIPEGSPLPGDGLSGAAMVRSLSDVLPRLALMGYDLAAAAREYDWVAQADREQREMLNDSAADLPEQTTQIMPFEEFRAFVAGVALADLDDTFVEEDHGSAAWRRRVVGRFGDEAFNRCLPRHSPYDDGLGWSERSHFGTLIGFLHPYALLVLLAENPANHDAPVIWCYGPLVEAGWAEADDFVPGARRRDTFLLATEGTSDAQILRRAFAILRPDVEDFFRFVDVRDGHPFQGVGGMTNFARGLVNIDVQNRVLFILDNDAEGVDGLRRIEALALPDNMRAITLSDLPELAAIPTVGPDGTGISDINGRAAALECYLDLHAYGLPPPVIRWTSYNRHIDAYQGALDRKDDYAQAFHRLASSPGYDLSKVAVVLDRIVAACAEIAAAQARTASTVSSPASP